MLSPAEQAEMALIERELTQIQKRIISATEEEELVKCASDPWYWFQHYVSTLDETDLENTLKRYPDYEYCHDLVRCWQAYPEYRLFAVEKSRRMLVTLTLVGLFTWDAQFGDGHLNFIVSTNEDKAAIQIERRAKVMYEHQPDFIKAAYPAFPIYCELTFPGKIDADKYGLDKQLLRKKATSKILSLPQKGEQLRSETPSNVLLDEVTAQSEAESNYSALAPALEAGKKDSGARLWAVSTAGSGFFDTLVHDRL